MVVMVAVAVVDALGNYRSGLAWSSRDLEHAQLLEVQQRMGAPIERGRIACMVRTWLVPGYSLSSCFELSAVSGGEDVGARGGGGMANGQWQMANGKWQMADGKWQMANGKRQMANGKRCHW